MFIDARRNQDRPPSGGPCYRRKAEPRPPSVRVGRAIVYRRKADQGRQPGGGRARHVAGSINIALLAEGGRVTSRVL